MFYHKDRSQFELPINLSKMNDKKFKIIKDSIYHLFRVNILPILPVKIFLQYFNEKFGRKSKDLQSMIGLFIFQALFDMTDKQVVEAYNFDRRIQYALDLNDKKDYLAIRTFYYYKDKILNKGMNVFEAVLKKIDDLIKIDTSLQRTDSSLVKLNLKKMSQWELFKTVLTMVLNDIQSEFQNDFETIPEEIKKYIQGSKSDSWFTGFSPSKADEYVLQAAQDTLTLKDLFEKHHEISKLDSFLLLLRLVEEQITITDDQQLKVEIKEEYKGSALCNPHDPEIQYNGHKKTPGVKLTLSETCSQDKDTEDPHIITNVEVHKANVSDQDILQETIDHREEKGLQPEVELTDNGFESDANHQALAEKDIDLIAPPTGNPPEGFGVLDFERDNSNNTIVSCPMGQACKENKVNNKKQKTISYFDNFQCKECPHKQDCPVKLTKNKAKLDWNWSKPRLEIKRLKFEEDQETIDLFRQRSGGEAVFSELKNTMGLGRLRIRGFDKAELAIVLRATGLNLRRLFNWLNRGDQGRGASKSCKYRFMELFLLFLCFIRPANWAHKARYNAVVP